jgi:hypothetical protein
MFICLLLLSRLSSDDDDDDEVEWESDKQSAALRLT